MGFDNDRARRGLGIAAAIVASSLVAIHLHQKGVSNKDLFAIVDEMPFRPLEPLLSGNAAPHPFRPAEAHASLAAADLQLRAAASVEIGRGTDAHRIAVARLLLGDTSSAVEKLAVLAQRSGNANVFSDLSAALLTRAAEVGDEGLVADAFGAANRALLVDPKCRPAAFNCALALERLGLIDDARRAWQQYLHLTPPAPQIDEALVRLHALAAGKSFNEWRRSLPTVLRLREPARDAALRNLVRRNPEEARAAAETVVMADWADAILCGDVKAADESLQIARRISVHLHDLASESLLADAVAAAERHQQTGTAELLATAQAIYRDGRLDHNAHRAAIAERELREAIRLFEKASSPMAYVARYYLGSALHAQQRLSESVTVLDALDKEPLQSHGYYAVAAMIGWERGGCLLESGALAEAVDVFTRSRSAFMRLGELHHVAVMDAFIGGSMDRLGDEKMAWQARWRALAGLSRAGRTDSYLVAIEASAASAIRHRKWDGADALLGLVIANAESDKRNVPVVAHAFAQRALIDIQRGDFHAAARNASASRVWAIRLKDTAIRARADADCAFVEAMIARSRDPQTALVLFDEALRHYQAADQQIEIPRLYLERGRTQQRLGHLPEARRDFDAGIAIIEMERHHIRDIEQRASLMSASDEIFTEAIDAAMTAGDGAAAFELSERDRSRALTEMYALGYASSSEVRPLSLVEIQRALAADAAIIEYRTLPDRLVIFVVRSDLFYATAVPSRDAVSAAIVQQLRKVIREGTDEVMRAAAGADALLLHGVRGKLGSIRHVAFVGDAHLSDVPFSALYNLATRRFLIEDVDVFVAPSATLLIQTSRATGRRADPPILAVGANVFAFDRYPDLSPLEATDNEVARVTAMYTQSKRLTGRDATRANVVASLAAFPTVHIAAHGLADLDVPARSALLFAPAAAGDGGELRAGEIARQRLPKTKLVILASCDSAARARRRDGADNLALAFIAAGVPTVVATLWDLPDDDSVRLMTMLHRGIADGRDPAAVLREIVIADLHDRDATTPPPRSCALVVVGGSPTLLKERKDQP